MLMDGWMESRTNIAHHFVYAGATKILMDTSKRIVKNEEKNDVFCNKSFILF